MTREGVSAAAATAAAVAPVVVFACGNPSRGDDALGPLLLARLREWLAAQALAADFELIDDFQLQIEHALDLEGRALALFIDAGQGTPAPFSFAPATVASAPAPGSHALTPAAVLAVHARIVGAPPPAFVLCVRGDEFELGTGLGAAATAHAEAAFRLLQRLVAAPCAAEWLRLATASAAAG